jgi:phosphohistidine phosphatase
MLFGKFMRIFIMRHGQAQPMATSDQLRELTEHGKVEVAKMAGVLLEDKLDFDAIYVSPYIRAQQTANIVKSVLATPTSLITLNFITPNDTAQPLQDYIYGHFSEQDEKSDQNILIVSHMPLVSYLVAEFTNGQHAPLFQTASVAEIDYNVNTMQGQLIAHCAPY